MIILENNKKTAPGIINSILFIISSFYFFITFVFITVVLALIIQFVFPSKSEIKGRLGSEIYDLQLIQNGKVTEFEFTNIWYINKNLLHCKVENINEKFDIYEALKENNWKPKDYYYIKNNIVTVVEESENGNTVFLNMYLY